MNHAKSRQLPRSSVIWVIAAVNLVWILVAIMDPAAERSLIVSFLFVAIAALTTLGLVLGFEKARLAMLWTLPGTFSFLLGFVVSNTALAVYSRLWGIALVFLLLTNTSKKWTQSRGGALEFAAA